MTGPRAFSVHADILSIGGILSKSLLAIVGVLAVAGAIGRAQAPAPVELKVGDMAPDFTVVVAWFPANHWTFYIGTDGKILFIDKKLRGGGPSPDHPADRDNAGATPRGGGIRVVTIAPVRQLPRRNLDRKPLTAPRIG